MTDTPAFPRDEATEAALVMLGCTIQVRARYGGYVSVRPPGAGDHGRPILWWIRPIGEGPHQWENDHADERPLTPEQALETALENLK